MTFANYALLDHLVVAAIDLPSGTEYIERLLGAPTEEGGDHLTQGTHNRLVRLSDDQYLEVISINPCGQKPAHPRWFELDSSEMQTRIATSPRLITWAVRVSDINQIIQIPPYDQCDVQSLFRGDLRWKVALTPDGRLLEGGILPLTIEWQGDVTPPHRLSDSGCKIQTVTIHHPDTERIERTFAALGLATPVSVHKGKSTQLLAELQTPNGGARLCSSA